VRRRRLQFGDANDPADGDPTGGVQDSGSNS
jgi:hypothetical protein